MKCQALKYLFLFIFMNDTYKSIPHDTMNNSIVNLISRFHSDLNLIACEFAIKIQLLLTSSFAMFVEHLPVEYVVHLVGKKTESTVSKPQTFQNPNEPI